MRGFIVSSVVLLLATSVVAQLPVARQPDKIPQPVAPNVPLAERRGGDDLLSAFVIPALPLVTSGTTTGYNNYYDEACPYTGSTAPEVVYAYTPAADVAIEIDLCGSSYDTKVYVYDGTTLTVVACNDDYYFGPPCGHFVSYLAYVPLIGGRTYYIVVDGYGTAHGDYQLAINVVVPAPPCILLPSCSATIENEPPLVYGYVDMHNGGCASQQYGAPFSEMWVDPYGWPPEFFGTSGWYQGPQGQNYRDTDWLSVQVDTWGVDVTIIAQQPVILSHLGPTDCQNYQVINSIMVDACTEGTLYVPAPGHEPVWLMVAPQTFTPPPGYSGGEFEYRLGFFAMPPSCMYLGPSSDYSFGGEMFQVTSYSTSFWTAGCHDDVDMKRLCDTADATPGGDTMVPIYMEAGQRITGDWSPFWILSTEGDAARGPAIIALVSDLRGDLAGCVHAVACYEYNCYFSLTAQETGWHWLVVDTPEAGNSNQWGRFGISSLAVPPPPPAHDTCAGAIPIPAGAFAFVDDLTTATNQVDAGRDGCPGAPHLAYTSRDVLYHVTLPAGHTLDATLIAQGGWDAALYLVQDCEEPLGACVAAGELEDGHLRLRYTATVDQTLWLVCDSYGLGERPYTLFGTLDQATAVPNDTPPALPLELSVMAAPNPFNPATRISYALPRSGSVLQQIVGLDGKLVRTLVNEEHEAGQHDLIWDGCDASGRTMASGVYVVRLVAGGRTASGQVLLLK